MWLKSLHFRGFFYLKIPLLVFFWWKSPLFGPKIPKYSDKMWLKFLHFWGFFYLKISLLVFFGEYPHFIYQKSPIILKKCNSSYCIFGDFFIWKSSFFGWKTPLFGPKIPKMSENSGKIEQQSESPIIFRLKTSTFKKGEYHFFDLYKSRTVNEIFKCKLPPLQRRESKIVLRIFFWQKWVQL